MNGGLVGLADTIARAAVSFLIQSTLLIGVALLAARFLAKTAAMRSAIYRATLLAVVALPVVSAALLDAGFGLRVVPLPEACGAVSGPPLLSAREARDDPRRFDEVVSRKALACAFWLPDQDVGATSPIGLAAALYMGLALAWAAVSLVLLFLFTRANHVLAQIRLHADTIEDQGLVDELAGIAEQSGVRPPELLRSRALASPVLTGIVHPAIILPDRALGGPPEKLRTVLLHEVAHLRNRDCLVLLLARMACAVFFFQPLLWVLVRRLEEASDEVTDDAVLVAGIAPATYARDLADWAAHFLPAPRESAVGVGVIRFRSTLAKRVRRILDATRPLQTALSWTTLLTTFLAAGMACAAAGTAGLRFPRVNVVVTTLDGSVQTHRLSDDSRGTQWLRISNYPDDNWLLWPYRGGRELAFLEVNQCIVVNQDGQRHLAGIVVHGPDLGAAELHLMLHRPGGGFTVWCAGAALPHLPTLPGDRDLTLVCDVWNTPDLRALASQTEVTRLLIHGCEQMRDLSPLQELSGLEYLVIVGCPKGMDLRPLRKLPRLQTLEVQR